MTSLCETIRRKIIEAHQRGVSYYEIARDSKVDFRAVAHFAKGERNHLRPATLDKLAEYFGLEVVQRGRKKS